MIDETQLKNTRFGVSGTAATVANLAAIVAWMPI